MEEMNQFGLQYIYTWRCHKATPFIAILSRQKCHFVFYKNGEQEGGTGPVWGIGTCGRGEDVGKW
jgi:hypothetical protein